MGKNQHVVSTGDGDWGVKGAGNEQFTSRKNTQTEAIDVAKNIAVNQKSEVVIFSILSE